MDRVLLASQLQTKGEHAAVELDGRAAACMHTGSGVSFNPKFWTCEDSASLHRLSDGSLLACVADSHWGGGASEAVARGLRGAWEAASGDPPATAVDRLRGALARIEQEFAAARARDDGSETTVLLVHLSGNTLSYLNVGDSLLLVLGQRDYRLRNRPGGNFFGQHRVLDVPGAVETGSFMVAKGELILLATDGLEPQASGLELPEAVALLRGGGTLSERLGRLLQRAAGDGGRDNLALVGIEV